MRKTIAAMFLFGCLAVPASASQEQIRPPNYIMISANAGGTFGEVTVEIKTDKKLVQPKITGIRLKINGSWKKVPKKAFTDLGSPDLNTAQIRTEAGHDKDPWLHIYFEVNHKDKSGNWNPQKVHISYHKGRFEYRSITTPIDGSRSDWQKIDL